MASHLLWCFLGEEGIFHSRLRSAVVVVVVVVPTPPSLCCPWGEADVEARAPGLDVVAAAGEEEGCVLVLVVVVVVVIATSGLPDEFDAPLLSSGEGSPKGVAGSGLGGEFLGDEGGGDGRSPEGLGPGREGPPERAVVGPLLRGFARGGGGHRGPEGSRVGRVVLVERLQHHGREARVVRWSSTRNLFEKQVVGRRPRPRVLFLSSLLVVVVVVGVVLEDVGGAYDGEPGSAPLEHADGGCLRGDPGGAVEE